MHTVRILQYRKTRHTSLIFHHLFLREVFFLERGLTESGILHAIRTAHEVTGAILPSGLMVLAVFTTAWLVRAIAFIFFHISEPPFLS